MMKLGLVLGVLTLSIVAAHAEGDAVAGAEQFKKCLPCHAVGADAANKVGPPLNGILGRTIGSQPDFAYSEVMRQAGAEGEIWSPENLSRYLRFPKKVFPGTKMAFYGFRDLQNLSDVMAYLATLNADGTTTPQ